VRGYTEMIDTRSRGVDCDLGHGDQQAVLDPVILRLWVKAIHVIRLIADTIRIQVEATVARV
jgi:hypothetical protein